MALLVKFTLLQPSIFILENNQRLHPSREIKYVFEWLELGSQHLGAALPYFLYLFYSSVPLGWTALDISLFSLGRFPSLI